MMLFLPFVNEFKRQQQQRRCKMVKTKKSCFELMLPDVSFIELAALKYQLGCKREERKVENLLLMLLMSERNFKSGKEVWRHNSS